MHIAIPVFSVLMVFVEVNPPLYPSAPVITLHAVSRMCDHVDVSGGVNCAGPASQGHMTRDAVWRITVIYITLSFVLTCPRHPPTLHIELVTLIIIYR